MVKSKEGGESQGKKRVGPTAPGPQRQNPNFQPLQHPPASVTCKQPPGLLSTKRSDCERQNENQVRSMPGLGGSGERWSLVDQGLAPPSGCGVSTRNPPGCPEGGTKGVGPTVLPFLRGYLAPAHPSRVGVCMCAHGTCDGGCMHVMVQERLSYRHQEHPQPLGRA